MAAGSNFAFNKHATKALQVQSIEELVITLFKPPRVPSPTSYDVRFSHNTCVTGRPTDKLDTSTVSWISWIVSWILSLS